MFIPKDTRKVLEILYDDKPDKLFGDRTRLKLARREAEFEGDTKVLTAPERAACLSGTTYLSLYNNKLTKLSHVRTLSQHNKLEDINLGYNQLTDLPSSFGELKCLKRLWLDDNNLGPSLPSSILKLNQITHLNLNGNQLEQLPESLGTACPLIEELSIDGNRLTSLPESIGSMAGLKVLNLRGNKLESLPDSIGSLKSLQLLLVNSNRLKRLPRSMGGCTSLTTIQANCNQLVSLPGGLSQCGKLKKVNAANNAIEYLPLALLNAWHPSIDESIVRSGPHLIASYVAGHSDAPYNAAAGSSSGTDAMVDGATEDDRAAAGDDSDDLVLELPGHDNGVAEDGTSPAADEASDGDSGGDVASPSSPAGDGDGGAASSSSPTSSPAAHNLAGSFATPAKKLKAFIPRGAGLKFDLNISENPIVRRALGQAAYDEQEGFQAHQWTQPLAEAMRLERETRENAKAARR